MSLPFLGQTRSTRARDYLLHTPDAFIRAPLPGMERATAIVHAAPGCGANFSQYTAELEAGGTLGGCAAQRFCYVLAGKVVAGSDELVAGDYAYHPQGSAVRIVAPATSRVIVIEKSYTPLPEVPAPTAFTGRVCEVAAAALNGDPDVQVQTLMPDAVSYDFAVNVMSFQPGASLSMVELHVMEHGLVMLEGSGIYRLGCDWHAVTEGDFIWMAPYCPQWFAALGKTPARYLIYKDWNRNPQ